MFVRWVCTVPSEIPSRLPICLLVSPAATRYSRSDYITPGAEPPGWHPPGYRAPLPVHTVVIGGMPGWEIALIAVGAALLAAAVAVLVYRAWTSHRKPITAAA
jgi:hypothetical protein